MTSPTCRRCACTLIPGDLRCPVCAAVTEPHDHEAHDPFEVLQCVNCAAGVEYDPKHLTPSCPYCGASVQRVSVEELPDTVSSFLPYRVEPEEARQAGLKWAAGQSWFNRSKVRWLDVSSVWWVAWSIDARVLVSWTMDVWDSPRAAQRELAFEDVLVPASQGLTQAEVTALQPGYDQGSGEPERQGPDDADWEVFTMHRSTARRRLMALLDGLVTQRVVQGANGGVKNLHTDVLLRGLSSTTVSCPAYVMRYRYLGRERRVVVNGQSADVVAGQMPLSVGRLLTVAVIVVAAIVFLSLFA